AFLLATGAFVVGAAACGAAPTMKMVVAGRALQGVGGGMLIAAAHAMVREMFPEGLWPHMLAAISAAWGTAALGGPALGGALAALMLALRLDRTARVRLLPSGMLSLSRQLGKGYWMIFLLGMSTTPGGVYVPLLVQRLHGVSPAAAGYLYAVQSLSWTAGTF